jgi:ElaB/YqjD/DUF883 family membrane-anchored ribosome-binding protein
MQLGLGGRNVFMQTSKRRIERIKEIKNFIEKAPYQAVIIAVGIPFLLYYTFK